MTYAKRQYIIFIFFLITLCLGSFCIVRSVNNKKIITLNYQENNNIDYKVYLKENNFFDEKYMEKGKTYITSLIDYIKIDYSYNIKFDQEVNADYTYQIKAKIEANKTDNEAENYWEKEYVITEENKGSIKNKTNLSINQSVNVDYNKYNNILKDFKNSLGLTNSDGILKVYLEVKEKINGEEIETPINSKMILRLPLSQLAIEATIESDVNNRTNEIRKVVEEKNPAIILIGVIGVILLLMSITFIWILIRNKKIYSINNRYELELKKILTTYDSIIVNVEEKPSLEDYNVIQVESFEELIDAHSEIRMPINYYKGVNYSSFILLNDKSAWEYDLVKNNKKRSAKHER